MCCSQAEPYNHITTFHTLSEIVNNCEKVLYPGTFSSSSTLEVTHFMTSNKNGWINMKFPFEEIVMSELTNRSAANTETFQHLKVKQTKTKTIFRLAEPLI